MKLFHSFGPGVREYDGRSFADFLWAVARGRAPLIRSSGNDIRSFLYLEDVFAAFFVPMIDNPERKYSVGSSELISIKNFAQMVMDVAGLSGVPLFASPQKGYEQSPYRTIIPRCDWLKSTGWRQFVSLEDAIKRTLESIRFEISIS